MRSPPESWGRQPRSQPQRVVALHDRHALLPESETPLLAYGNGRSYGDVCLNDGGTVLRTRGLDRLIAFDGETGLLRCESGVLLGEILDWSMPRGWFVPVTPGTRQVTVGGAIANDVHGKNHHRVGSFGRHLHAFELLRSDGSRLRCTADENAELFAASIGGLGLTGLITWAEFRLHRVASAWLRAETIRFGSLDEFWSLSETSHHSHDYCVAWLDGFAPAAERGRGLFERGNFAPLDTGPSPPRERLRVPFTPPVPLIGTWSARIGSRLRYRHSRSGEAIRHYRSFFYPLDGVGDWNRVYGPRGFVQHQSVLPPASMRTALPELLDAAAGHGDGPFLAVLKTFGDLPSPGLLSFPRAGATLALDFPFRGASTLALVDRLSRIVMQAGGALYPAKDAHMSGEQFRQSFPNWQRFGESIDPRFSSGFWRRMTQTQATPA